MKQVSLRVYCKSNNRNQFILVKHLEKINLADAFPFPVMKMLYFLIVLIKDHLEKYNATNIIYMFYKSFINLFLQNS